VESCCKHGNQPSGSIEFRGILEWMSDWWLLKKDLGSCSYLSHRSRVGWLEDVVHDLRETKLNRWTQKKILKNGNLS
jgi:hypothetical protein